MSDDYEDGYSAGWDAGEESARAELTRLRAENDVMRTSLQEIISGYCPSKYPMNSAGLVAYHRDLARAALAKETK